MSLKIFHVFFILISIGLSVYFGFWGVNHSGTTGYLWMGIGSFALSIGLIAYLVYFVKKMSRQEFNT